MSQTNFKTPSSMDAINWLTNIINNTTTSLISELEIQLISDTHTLFNERKIKHKHKNIQIQQAHFQHNVNILLDKFQSNIKTAVQNLANQPPTLTLNMSLLKTTPHLFKHTKWEPSTLNSSPKTLLQITSHDMIYNQLKDLQNNIIFIDTETDGLNTYKNNILSICLTTIKMEQNILHSSNPQEHHFYIKPNKDYKINPNCPASQVHKISQTTLNQKGHYLTEIGPTIIKLLANKIAVGFNINNFDIPMIRNNLQRHNINLPPIKTIDLYQAHHKLIKHDLQSALKDLLCYPIPNHLQHSANADTDACIRLLAALTDKLNLPTNLNSYLNTHTQNYNKHSIFNTSK